jgi:transposase
VADLSWENVIWVGADEMNRKKGHNYLTVFVDLQAKRVLLAVEGKDASVWERFAAELGNHNGHPRAVTMVAIDMSPAYQRGCGRTLGTPRSCSTSFMWSARWSRRWTKCGGGKRGRMHGAGAVGTTSWLWRKNPENWTERESGPLGAVARQTAGDRLAYAMRLELQQAYAAPTAAQARKRFALVPWVQDGGDRVASGLLEPMRKPPTWWNDIGRNLGALATRTDDRLPGRTQQFVLGNQTRARGYRSSEYQTAMLYFVAGKLEIPYYAK